MEVIAVEHQKFYPLQPRQRFVLEPANAVEPKCAQKHHQRTKKFII